MALVGDEGKWSTSCHGGVSLLIATTTIMETIEERDKEKRERRIFERNIFTIIVFCDYSFWGFESRVEAEKI